MDIKKRMGEINTRLLDAAKAYYNEDREIMSNFEYDALYDELVALEKEHGVLLSDSITQQAGVDTTVKRATLNNITFAKDMLGTPYMEQVITSWILKACQQKLLRR